MNAEEAKIRLKIGAIEIDYEGRASFLKDDLINLLGKVVAFYADHKSAIPTSEPIEQVQAAKPRGVPIDLDQSTNTIAARLGGTSGSDLVIAAAAYLTFVKKQDTFTRAEVLAEMKAVTTYYTKFMSTNFSKMLSSLVKVKRLNQVASGSYALSAAERTAVEAKLAQSA